MDAADLLPDPIAQFRRWLDEARAAGVEMPEAMTLATADAGRAALGAHGAPQGGRRRRLPLLHEHGEQEGARARREPSGGARLPLAAGAAAAGDRRRDGGAAPARRGRGVLPHAPAR